MNAERAGGSEQVILAVSSAVCECRGREGHLRPGSHAWNRSISCFSPCFSTCERSPGNWRHLAARSMVRLHRSERGQNNVTRRGTNIGYVSSFPLEIVPSFNQIDKQRDG